MTLKQYIQQTIVSLWIRPFAKEKPLEFRTALKQAGRILVLLPPADRVLLGKALDQIASLFPGRDITALHPGLEDTASRKSVALPIHYLNLKKESIRALSKSAALGKLVKRRFDLFLDLNPAYSLLGIYLCRRARAPVRIGFEKPQSHRFYNFVYESTCNGRYADALSGLTQFLGSLVSR